MPSDLRITDGQTNFEGGIDSGKVTTLASEANPSGLKRNQLAWATNCTMRGGGVTCRTGWKGLSSSGLTGLYQGGGMYEPDAGFPYPMVSIAGHIYRIRTDTDNSWEDISIPGDFNSATADQAWFQQAEQFMVIQNGVDLPLIWDGTTMWRSNPYDVYKPGPPIGTCMDYYMGRLWIAINGREYVAGDIVLGPSGTPAYRFRDSVLYFTENLWLAGGGSFIIPTNEGEIRALKHTANLDTALGQGQLFVFTRKAIYSCNVPPTRTEWQNLSEPLQRIAQIGYGAYGDRGVVSVNGDLFYQSIDGIRSLMVAIRYFHQWGQTPLSHAENRLIRFNDRSLMRFSSGIEFDNRLLESAYPVQTPSGVVFKDILPLDFDLISTIAEKEPPAWEGDYQGLDMFQLFKGDFGGLQRAFSTVLSTVDGTIWLWELTATDRFQNGDNRTDWFIETPSYIWGDEFKLKKLDGLELWIDKVFGTVDFEVYYRQDQSPCWRFWHAWSECAARTNCEDINADEPCYVTQQYCEQYRSTIQLPRPYSACESSNGRPTDIGYQFQIKIVVKGWCRIRGILVHALPVERAPFNNRVCP